jgi:hypothetical protein
VPLLSPQVLSDLRAVVATALVDACTVERASVASDGQGGQVPTWANLATGVACRLRRPTDGTEAEIAGRLTGVVAWAVMLPAFQDVAVADRLLVTSMTPNRRFLVRAVLAPVTDEVVRTVIADEVQA